MKQTSSIPFTALPFPIRSDGSRTAVRPDTREWIEAQNAVTHAFLDTAHRRRLLQELTRSFDYPRTTAPLRRGSRYFFSHNPGLLSQAVLYVQDTLDDVPRVLLDPNTLSADGTVALTAIEPSADGALLAYAISHQGSDRQDIRIRNVDTGLDLPDCLHWVKFASLAWTIARDGLFYLRFPEPGTVPPEDEQVLWPNLFSSSWGHAVRGHPGVRTAGRQGHRAVGRCHARRPVSRRHGAARRQRRQRNPLD